MKQVTMQDSELTGEFCNYLRNEKRRSDQTAKCCGAALEKFCEFLLQHFGAKGTDDGQNAAAVGQKTGFAVLPQTKNGVDQLLM